MFIPAQPWACLPVSEFNDHSILRINFFEVPSSLLSCAPPVVLEWWVPYLLINSSDGAEFSVAITSQSVTNRVCLMILVFQCDS